MQVFVVIFYSYMRWINHYCINMQIFYEQNVLFYVFAAFIFAF